MHLQHQAVGGGVAFQEAVASLAAVVVVAVVVAGSFFKYRISRDAFIGATIAIIRRHFEAYI